MKRLTGFALAIALCFNSAIADELLMVRSSQNFEDAMTTLQTSIAEHGYKVTRVQRVDVGLEAKGYKTDRYRIVFYGKAGEVEALAAKFPKLIPYLPLAIAIFAEENNTILTTTRPASLKRFYPESELKPIFDRWDKDLVEIMDDVREAK